MKTLSPAEVEEARGSPQGILGMKATAQDALSEMLRTGERFIFVEDERHDVVGVLDFENLLEMVNRHGITS